MMNQNKRDWITRRQQYKIRIEKHMEQIDELRMFYVKELTNIDEEIEFMKMELRLDT